MANAATSKNGAPNTTADPSNTLRVEAAPGADQAKLFAMTALRPSVRAAVTTQTYYESLGQLDLTALVDELAGQTKSVNNGDLRRPEAMLVAQAHTLEAIFHELARRAASNMGQYMEAAETYMRLALKAQSQCRATLETLAAIKNPSPVAFVRQANIAHGLQQVNNAPQSGALRAGNSENPPNKLLEAQRNEWLDAGRAQAAASRNSSVEALGVVNGTNDDPG